MKLLDVFAGYGALVSLSKCKVPPKMAFALSKYLRLVQAEYDLIEKQRVALLHEATGTRDGEDTSVQYGTPQYIEYAEKFGPLLDSGSDLVICSLNLSDVMDCTSDSMLMDTCSPASCTRNSST